MRILRVITTLNPDSGGVAAAVTQSISYLNKKSIQVDILSFDEKSYCDSYEANFNHIYLGNGTTEFQFHFGYVKWLIKNAKNYDLVVIDGLWQFHVIGGLFLHWLKVPYCVFVHGMLDPYFNENKLKYIKKLPFWFFSHRSVLARARNVIFTVEKEAEKALNAFPFSKWNKAICTLGFDIPKNIPVSKQPKSGTIYLSRIHPKKGLELIISAYENDIDLKLDNLKIFGVGEDSYIRHIKELINNSPSKKSLIFKGGVFGLRKWEVIKSAELFSLISHQENFGIAVAESLACGTPVLISNKVDIHHIIEKYSAGIVVENTAHGAKTGFEKWSKMCRAEREEMSRNAIRCYKENFTEEIAGKQVYSLISNALQKRKS